MKRIALAALAALSAGAARAETIGHASYYGRELAGRKTASGERFDPGAMTAAHRSLPFGTRLRLTHLRTGRTTIVRVNDRGPFVRGRVLDVSHGAARALGFAGQGTALLRIEPLGRGFTARAEDPAPAPRAETGLAEAAEHAPGPGSGADNNPRRLDAARLMAPSAK
ncbi:septal ring lytic transglycosylase RlpA family protein [Rhabdaerophilum calidifontis]|uniref:septal ring lytic transglycosylase RlpA family protein n=1 Tax=Rhabdaerophilum calidifontis TaxID=2604328 RepID=UPI00123A10AD|nr:septal ring lytic transglycosylase RlpA family protein [Rhabdaerophilum calidifontis]